MRLAQLPQHILDLNQDVLPSDRSVEVSKSRYRSKLEERVAAEWIPGQVPDEWYYEPVTFKLPGGNYTPDFMLVYYPDLNVRSFYKQTFIEAKGWTQSLRADRRAFKEAATMYHWHRLVWLTWDKNDGWIEDWWPIYG